MQVKTKVVFLQIACDYTVHHLHNTFLTNSVTSLMSKLRNGCYVKLCSFHSGVFYTKMGWRRGGRSDKIPKRFYFFSTNFGSIIPNSEDQFRSPAGKKSPPALLTTVIFWLLIR